MNETHHIKPTQNEQILSSKDNSKFTHMVLIFLNIKILMLLIMMYTNFQNKNEILEQMWDHSQIFLCDWDTLDKMDYKSINLMRLG